MKCLSSLALIAALSLALASPALAEISTQKGANLCKAEIAKQDPAPRAIRIDKEGVKMDGGMLVYTMRVTDADNQVGNCSALSTARPEQSPWPNRHDR